VRRVAILTAVAVMVARPPDAGAEQERNAMQENVKREDGKVWIEGDAPLEFDLKTPNSTMKALSLIMQAAGENLTYEYLMGASGTAFRFQLHDKWCPSSAHSGCGTETHEGAMNTIPFEFTRYDVKKGDASGVASVRKAVAASIDRGMPVMYGSEEDGVVLGGDEWLCVHPLKDYGKRVFIDRKWPWAVVVFGGRKAPQPDARQCAVDALKMAVKLAKSGQVGRYDCGLSAWQTWTGQLKGESSIDGGPNRLGNWWIYLSLADARRCASAYLRSVAGHFTGPARAHLRRAADLYAEMVDEILASEGPSKIAPSPFEKNRKWTDEDRVKQAGILGRALVIEKQAIAEIQLALDAIEK